MNSTLGKEVTYGKTTKVSVPPERTNTVYTPDPDDDVPPTPPAKEEETVDGMIEKLLDPNWKLKF